MRWNSGRDFGVVKSGVVQRLAYAQAMPHGCGKQPDRHGIFHCYDRDADYKALDRLLETDQPLIVAHPNALGTNLERVPPECLIEINNRYVWRCDWRSYYGPFVRRFQFVIGSDAHQPNWLNQTVARHVAAELGVREKLLFDD